MVVEKKMKQLINELHKPARRHFLRRKVDIRDLDETWQADLVQMSPYASVNKEFNFLLTVIDNFSKYAFAIPIKSKSGKDVSHAMESILKKVEYQKIYTLTEEKNFIIQHLKV